MVTIVNRNDQGDTRALRNLHNRNDVVLMRARGDDAPLAQINFLTGADVVQMLSNT